MMSPLVIGLACAVVGAVLVLLAAKPGFWGRDKFSIVLRTLSLVSGISLLTLAMEPLIGLNVYLLMATVLLVLGAIPIWSKSKMMCSCRIVTIIVGVSIVGNEFRSVLLNVP